MSAARRQRGTALYLVVTLVIILAGFAAALATSMAVLIRDSAREGPSLAALHAAEGGLALARASLARDPGFAGATVAIGSGRAEVRVESVEDRPDLRRVRVRGVVPATDAPGATIERRIAAIVVLQGGLPRVVSWREVAE